MPIAAIDANISMTKKEIRDFSFTFSDRIRTFLFMLTVRFTFARSFIERVVLFKQVNHCESDKKTREHNSKVEKKFFSASFLIIDATRAAKSSGKSGTSSLH